MLCALELDDRVGRIDDRCCDAEQSNGHPKAHRAESPHEHRLKSRQEKRLPFSRADNGGMNGKGVYKGSIDVRVDPLND